MLGIDPTPLRWTQKLKLLSKIPMLVIKIIRHRVCGREIQTDEPWHKLKKK